MIFDTEDLVILNRTIVRKSCEIAMSTFDQNLGESRRILRVEAQISQLKRLRIMAGIAINDVADMGGMLDVLEERRVMPPDLLAMYLSSLEGRDSEDEAAIAWMGDEMSFQMPLLREAVRIADTDGSTCSITESDVVIIRGVRGIMTDMAERCRGQDPEVLGDAREYIDAVLGLCSALLRISAMRPVDSIELSAAAMRLDTVSDGSFHRLFDDVLDQRSHDILEAFDSGLWRYIAALYARCILNSRYPQSASIRDSPASG